MNNIKIVAVIVVYNKKIKESITFSRIKKMPDIGIQVLVIDNSESEMGNGIYCMENRIKYISMNGNAGLSKAYNAAINASTDSDIIVLLDDDTEITEEYFKILIKKASEYEDIDIFAPVIYGQDGVIYSPNEFNFLRNHFIKTPEQEVSQNAFNAIASCLAIRTRVFNGYRFNEKLFIDQVDQFFFCEQRKRKMKFLKLDVEIIQNFYQRGEILSKEAGWTRLRIRIIDIMRHARLMCETKYIIFGFIKCCGLGVQIGKKTKSILIVFKSVILAIKCFFVVF